MAPVNITTAPIIKGKNLEYVLRMIKGGTSVEKQILIKSVVL